MISAAEGRRFTLRGSQADRRTSPRRALAYRRSPPTLSAENMGGRWRMAPTKPCRARSRSSSAAPRAALVGGPGRLIVCSRSARNHACSLAASQSALHRHCRSASCAGPAGRRPRSQRAQAAVSVLALWQTPFCTAARLTKLPAASSVASATGGCAGSAPRPHRLYAPTAAPRTAPPPHRTSPSPGPAAACLRMGPCFAGVWSIARHGMNSCSAVFGQWRTLCRSGNQCAAGMQAHSCFWSWQRSQGAPVYSLSASTWASMPLVAAPVHRMSRPVALGSSVPAWPICGAARPVSALRWCAEECPHSLWLHGTLAGAQ